MTGKEQRPELARKTVKVKREDAMLARYVKECKGNDQ